MVKTIQDLTNSPTAFHNRKIEQEESPSESEEEKTVSLTDLKVSYVAHSAIPVNITYSIVNLVLAKEQLNNEKLHHYAGEASKIQDSIELLVNLNGKLSVSDQDIAVTDEVRQMAQDLQKQNIEILHDGEKTIKPERMTEIKALIGSHTDRLKTQLQQIFTTKIQVVISETNSILEAVRMILKYDDRLKSTMISNQRKQ